MYKKTKFISVFAIFSILYLLIMDHYYKGLFSTGDDQFFLNGVKEFDGNLYKFLDYRYKIWSARVFLEGIMVTIINLNVWVWRIVNILIILFLTFSINKFTQFEDKENKNQLLAVFIICLGLFSLHKEVYFTSILWVVGSFNYLWPVSFGIFSLLPFKYELFKEKYNKKLYFIYLLSIILGCNSEQSAAVSICFSLIIIIYLCTRDKRINVILIISNIFMIMNGIFLFKAPGNHSRYIGEMLTNFPEFDMLTTIEKLYRGLTLYISHVFYKSTLLSLIITLIMSILIFNKYKDKFIRFLSIIPVIPLIFVIGYNLFHSEAFEIAENRAESFYLNFNFRMYLSIGIGLWITLLIIYLLYIIFDSTEKKLIIVTSYLAAIASALSLSFSPTMYASGMRIFFMTDILFTIIISILIKEIFSLKLYKNIFIKIIFFIFISCCIFNGYSLIFR